MILNCYYTNHQYNNTGYSTMFNQEEPYSNNIHQHNPYEDTYHTYTTIRQRIPKDDWVRPSEYYWGWHITQIPGEFYMFGELTI